MPRIIHFDISSNDVDGSRRFYEQVFGWSFQKWDGPVEYWLVTTGPDSIPGINGGLARAEEEQAGTVNSIDVASVDETAAHIEKAGGKILRPKMAIPGVGWMAYCRDPGGATFGIFQEDPDAS